MPEAKLVYRKRLVEQVAARPERRGYVRRQLPIEEAKHAEYPEAGARKRPRGDVGGKEANSEPAFPSSLRRCVQRNGRDIDAKRGRACTVVPSAGTIGQRQQIGASSAGEIKRDVRW